MSRALRFGLLGLLLAPKLALAAWLASPGYAMPRTLAKPSGAALPVIEVKLKCGLGDDGVFRCVNVKKKQNEGNPPRPGKKCKGPNDCGPGYRDLDAPNRYGACCEEVDAPAKGKEDETGPKTGKCQQVEQMNQLSCSAPFGSYSCGPLKDGVMTCCCVK